MLEVIKMPYDTEYRFYLKNGQYLTDEDVCKKLDYIYNLKPEEPQKNTIDYSWDEIGLSRIFADLYKPELRYCIENKCWYVYNGIKWVQDTGALLANEKIKEFFSILYIYCSEKEIKKFSESIHKLSSKSYRDKILKDTASVYPISVNEFDKDPYLINCKNGVFDLKKGEFRKHKAEDFFAQSTNFCYCSDGDFDPEVITKDVRCKRFEQFIDEVTEGDKEKAKYLQYALGYSILGKASEECLFLVYGKTTRNGKSTLLNAILHALGDYATTTTLDLICKSSGVKDLNAASPMLANLKGKRLVVMSETEEHGKLDESKVKTLTGGEEISCRKLYGEPFSYLPQFTMWVTCNDLPAAYDNALFESGRLKVIEFSKHFTEKEQDKTLKDYFRTQEAMQGIFYWLMLGCYGYQKFGLHAPEIVESKIKEYQEDNNLTLQFLNDCCEVQPWGYVKASELFEIFQTWAKKRGYFSGSIRTFNKSLKMTSWQGNALKYHLGGGRRLVFDGIGIRKDLNLFAL